MDNENANLYLALQTGKISFNDIPKNNSSPRSHCNVKIKYHRRKKKRRNTFAPKNIGKIK